MGDEEQELLNRIEKTEVLKTRFEIEKLELAKRNEQRRKAKEKDCSPRSKYRDGVQASSKGKDRRRIFKERKGKLNKKAQPVKDPKAERKKQCRERKRIQRE